MESLAAEFLDYARGEIRLHMSVVTLEDVFKRFVDSMSAKLERSDVSLRVINEVTKPVILDADRFLRVLINAGENACKAMTSGGSLFLEARATSDALKVIIRDTGCGMSPEVLSHIFEPFYSGSSGGTGLGMLIIKTIVDAHHGTVVVSSAEGEGTSVEISLPLLG
jgi:signal transduction histidine kinase